MSSCIFSLYHALVLTSEANGVLGPVSAHVQ